MKSNLNTRRWMPANSAAPAGSVYLVHGISEHSGRYQDIAGWLSDHGWIVGAHDHHGFGQSDGARGRLRDENAYVQDTVRSVNAFASETGTTPYLFGHSMGGVIATASALTGDMPIGGLALSSPAFRPALSSGQLWQLRIMSCVAPNFVLERSLDPNKLTHDQGVAQAYRSDELVHGFVSARLVNWIVRTGANCLERAGELNVPLLLLGAGADVVIGNRGLHEFESAVCADLTCHWYDGYRHELFNELPEMRARPYQDLLTWLENQTVKIR